ncbi:MAG: eukaryotic-like serine/threonine-protein kinase [Thermoleophilaceae bacterium]|nr:eukaryotic-like serine/threonine-protein kinase [Thermoleophilaceae bacterium]
MSFRYYLYISDSKVDMLLAQIDPTFSDGGSVATLVAERGGRLAIEEAVSIVLQALDGLAYAHTAEIPAVRLADGTIGPSRGLVHRDIKPSNILLAGSGSARAAKLADFGLAKAFDRAGLSSLTSTGARGGTVEFMARTQIVNYRMARPEVDVWAIAASLYWMLTLAVPRDFPPAIDPVAVVLQGETVKRCRSGTASPRFRADSPR